MRALAVLVIVTALCTAAPAAETDVLGVKSTVSSTPPANTGNDSSINSIEATDKASSGPQSGAGFIDAARIDYAVGCAKCVGGRQALVSTISLNAPTAAANTNRNYVGFTSIGTANTGDGGTPANPLGGVFAWGAVCQTASGATYLLELSCGELNPVLKAGSSAHYKAGLSIVEGSEDAVQGYDWDCAYCLSSEVGAVGWRDGILFGSMNGQWPINQAGSMLATAGPGSVTNVIDASSIDIIGSVLKTKYLQITQTANGVTINAINGAVLALQAAGQGGITILPDGQTWIGGPGLIATSVASGSGYSVGQVMGVSCKGAPTSAYAVTGGIVTHC